MICQLLSRFAKITIAFIPGNSLYCIFLPCLLSPSQLFISMLFSVKPNRNIRSSSQIRQNPQVFHYSWFIAKWVHVLSKLSNMILPVSHICSRENNFLFKHVKVQLKIAKLLRRVIREKLETVLQLSNIYILNDIFVHHRYITSL